MNTEPIGDQDPSDEPPPGDAKVLRIMQCADCGAMFSGGQHLCLSQRNEAA